MAECPHCEYNKKRAQNWREEVYRLAGHPLPEQEPVAWMYICDGDETHPVLVHTQKDWTRASWWHEVPLYATPQQRTWVGLTKEDIDYLGIHTTDTHPEDFIRYVEAKLKEKNNDS